MHYSGYANSLLITLPAVDDKLSCCGCCENEKPYRGDRLPSRFHCGNSGTLDTDKQELNIHTFFSSPIDHNQVKSKSIAYVLVKSKLTATTTSRSCLSIEIWSMAKCNYL